MLKKNHFVHLCKYVVYFLRDILQILIYFLLLTYSFYILRCLKNLIKVHNETANVEQDI